MLHFGRTTVHTHQSSPKLYFYNSQEKFALIRNPIANLTGFPPEFYNCVIFWDSSRIFSQNLTGIPLLEIEWKNCFWKFLNSVV